MRRLKPGGAPPLDCRSARRIIRIGDSFFPKVLIDCQDPA